MLITWPDVAADRPILVDQRIRDDFSDIGNLSDFSSRLAVVYNISIGPLSVRWSDPQDESFRE